MRAGFEILKNEKISYLVLNMIKLIYQIFGLGNPEPKFRKTRHNIGKIFINDLANQVNQNFIENK